MMKTCQPGDLPTTLVASANIGRGVPMPTEFNELSRSGRRVFFGYRCTVRDHASHD